MKKQLLRFSTLCMLLMAAVASKAESVTATWDFHSSDGNYYAAGSANVQGSVGTLDATASDGSTIVLTVDASSGKLYSRGGDAQFNNGTTPTITITLLAASLPKPMRRVTQPQQLRCQPSV